MAALSTVPDFDARMDAAENKLMSRQELDKLIVKVLTDIALHKPPEDVHTAALWDLVQQLEPNSPEAFDGHGIFAQRNSDWASAADNFGKAMALRPSALGYLCLSVCHDQLGHIDTAIGYMKDCIAKWPKFHIAYGHLYTLYDQLGDLKTGREVMEAGLAECGPLPEIMFALAEINLKEGNYREGWRQYENRDTRRSLLSQLDEYPEWTGQELKVSDTLVVMRDQGMGDEIMFSRYLWHLADSPANVILFTYPDLARLFVENFPFLTVISDDKDIPKHMDYWVACGSLAERFGGDTATALPEAFKAPSLSRASQYVKPSPNLKVGLVWRGNKAHARDRLRSVSWEDFEPILAVEGVDFYSLQVGEIESGLPNLTEYVCDVADTAAVIQKLDLVICVDTMVGHLAASLGKPVWMILPDVTDWRWRTEGCGTDWYPSMTIFRPDVPREERGVAVDSQSDGRVPRLAVENNGAPSDRSWIARRIEMELRNLLPSQIPVPMKTGTRAEYFEKLEDARKETAAKRRKEYEAEMIARETKPDRLMEVQKQFIESGSKFSERFAAQKIRIGNTRYGEMAWPANDFWIGRSLELYGEYSQNEVDAFEELLTPDSIVIEVGAHIGALTLALKEYASRVYAFEPQPYYADLLEKNTRDEGNIEIFQMALGDYCGQIGIEPVETEKSFAPGREGAPVTAKAACTTIDSFGFEKVDFIKIDVDGQELAILRGAEETLKRCRPILYVEHDRPQCYPDMVPWLDAHGYRIYLHDARLYSPLNFKQNPVNVFGGIISKMLICIPQERKDIRPGDWGIDGISRVKVTVGRK